MKPLREGAIKGRCENAGSHSPRPSDPPAKVPRHGTSVVEDMRSLADKARQANSLESPAGDRPADAVAGLPAEPEPVPDLFVTWCVQCNSTFEADDSTTECPQCHAPWKGATPPGRIYAHGERLPTVVPLRSTYPRGEEPRDCLCGFEHPDVIASSLTEPTLGLVGRIRVICPACLLTGPIVETPTHSIELARARAVDLWDGMIATRIANGGSDD